MLSCDVICDLMAVYSSGEASAETRRLVEEHLAQCPSCRKALEGAPRLDTSLSGDGRVEKPSNGRGFVSRTRRLVYAIGVGVLLCFACQSAVLLRIAAKEMSGVSLRLFPGSGGLWFGIAAGCLALYIATVLVRTAGKQTGRDTGVGFALLAGILLCVLAVATFHLAVAGTGLAGIIAFFLLLSALVVTFARLSRLRYFTIVTLIVMLMANGILIAEAMSGFVNIDTLLSAQSVELGQPGRGITSENAVRLDLSSLGLSLVESNVVQSIGRVSLESGISAATAFYRGEGKEASLTIASFGSPHAASDGYRAWRSSALSTVRLMHIENNLRGPGGEPSHYMSTYNGKTDRAYITWQAGNWLTIIEVPGSMREARPLARKIREVVAESFKSSKGE